MDDLKEKLKRAGVGWNYLWNLLEKEVKRKDIKPDVLMVFYKYLVELDTDKHLLELYDEKLKSAHLSKEDEEVVREGLANYMSTFQAMAFTIENLLNG